MNGQWISVEEAFPVHGVPVLVVNGDGIRLATFHGVKYGYGGRNTYDWRAVHDTCGCCDSFDEGVTHWASLPELPDGWTGRIED